MLAIRFNRTGKRNQAHFRVVLQEHTVAPGKRHIEILGSYDPHKKTTILKKDRILYWIGQGAQVSDAVHNTLVREGVIDAKKIAKRMPRPVAKEPVVEVAPVEAPATETPVVAETPVAEAPVAEVAPVVEAAPVVEETPVVAEEKAVEAEVKA
ncbi:MAG: 30S ribosomal protein S16 [Candidatus Moraniibacteriota bacterium]